MKVHFTKSAKYRRAITVITAILLVLICFPIHTISQTSPQSFAAPNTYTNPGVDAGLTTLNANLGSKTVHAKQALISCTVACTINIGTETSLGTGCGPFGSTNLRVGSSVQPTSHAYAGCPTVPGGLALYLNVSLTPNTPTVFNLEGVTLPSNGTTGIFTQNVTPITGVISVTILWSEE